MRKTMRKKVFLSVAAIICISITAYFVITTRITCGFEGYSRDDRDYHLKEDEILYGGCYFCREGLAPIRIRNIYLINEQDIPVEVNVFFCERQPCQLSGGPINAAEFEETYGKNLISPNHFKWLSNDDKTFDIAITTKEDRIDSVWVVIEYSVFGIFPKKICSYDEITI